MFLEKRRIDVMHVNYFDMWRGGSALVVATAHMLQILAPAHARLFSALANAAVTAFFALSGFLIHQSLARCHDEHRGLDWRAFLRARCGRILFPFAASLALTVLLWGLAPWFFASGSRAFLSVAAGRAEYSLQGLWQTALLMNGFLGPTLSANGPLWSLTCEIWYYALACLASMALTGRSSTRWAGWAAAALLGVFTLCNPWFLLWGLTWLGGFIVSMRHAGGRLRPLPRLPLWLLPAAFLAAVVLVPQPMAGRAIVLFRLCFGAWMIWHMVDVLCRPEVRHVRFLAHASQFAYVLYIFHFPVLLFAHGISTAAVLPTFAAVLAFSAVAGPWLERLRPPLIGASRPADSARHGFALKIDPPPS